MAATIQQQFEQSMTLLAWFRNNPGASLTRASRELSMTVPQIRHELHMLMMCGLPTSTDTGFMIDVNFGQNSATIREGLGLNKPVNLTQMEAGVLLLSLESVRSTLPAHRHAAVDSAAQKIRQLMNAGKGSRGTGVAPDKVDPAHAELADLLSVAIAGRTLVTCDYLSLRSDSLQQRTLIPDHLGLVEGNMYLWAREVGAEQGAHKAYRLSRMDHIALGEPGSAEYAGPRRIPEIDAEDPFNFDHDQSWASLRLHPAARWMLEYYPMWHEEGSDEDEISVAFPNTGAWLERFLMGNADRIAVNTPETVAERVRQRARAGLTAYNRLDR